MQPPWPLSVAEIPNSWVASGKDNPAVPLKMLLAADFGYIGIRSPRIRYFVYFKDCVNTKYFIENGFSIELLN
jgi:hypothetical protein